VAQKYLDLLILFRIFRTTFLQCRRPRQFGSSLVLLDRQILPADPPLDHLFDNFLVHSGDWVADVVLFGEGLVQISFFALFVGTGSRLLPLMIRDCQFSSMG
jgi:hypothetical protein